VFEKTYAATLKNLEVTFFGFSKKRKNVCTVLETNLTEQSLTVQINNYMVFRKIRHPFSFFNILVTEKPIKVKFSAFVAKRIWNRIFIQNIAIC